MVKRNESTSLSSNILGYFATTNMTTGVRCCQWPSTVTTTRSRQLRACLPFMPTTGSTRGQIGRLKLSDETCNQKSTHIGLSKFMIRCHNNWKKYENEWVVTSIENDNKEQSSKLAIRCFEMEKTYLQNDQQRNLTTNFMDPLLQPNSLETEQYSWSCHQR